MINRFDPVGSTGDVDFQTRKRAVPTTREVRGQPRHARRRGRQHVGAAAAERARAEQERAAYVKNDHLGFTIPYVHKGRSHGYVPDFLVRLVSPATTRTSSAR